MSHYPEPIPYGPYPHVPAQQPPSNHLAWAIATAVMCCLPLSVVSIVYAARVDRLWMLGQHDQAARASRLARNWAIASAAVVVLLFGVVIVLGVTGVLDDTSGS